MDRQCAGKGNNLCCITQGFTEKISFLSLGCCLKPSVKWFPAFSTGLWYLSKCKYCGDMWNWVVERNLRSSLLVKFSPEWDSSGCSYSLNLCSFSIKWEFQKKKTSISVSSTMLKSFTVWIMTNCGKLLERWEYQTSLPVSWEICMWVKRQQLEPCMDNWLVQDWERSMTGPSAVTLLV